MSVRKKDRHVSSKESLEKSRALINYILILTRPRKFDKRGKQIQKPGILGEGQPYGVFGADILSCGKSLHAACFRGTQVHLKDIETLTRRRTCFKKGIEFCDTILQLTDLCISQYGLDSPKKMRSFKHLAELTRNVKLSLQDRINRDNMIYDRFYAKSEEVPVNF